MTRFSGSRVTSIIPGGIVKFRTKIGCRSAVFFGLLRNEVVPTGFEGDVLGGARCEEACRANVDCATV